MRKTPVTIERSTKETDITLILDISSREKPSLEFKPPFFLHLIHALAYHGNFFLNIRGEGDLEVDDHHFVEDVGLVFGEALRKSVEEYGPITRFGHAIIPMDDALSEVVIDVCGRPYVRFEAAFPQPKVGSFDIALLHEFLSALANTARMNLHAHCRYGRNSHHMAESLFKALGKAISAAYTPIQNGNEPRSTKGIL